MKITIYQKPSCSTCRKVYSVLKESGGDFDSVNYYIDPIPKGKLASLVKKMGLPASDLLRVKEKLYRDLKLSERKLSDDEVIDLMIEHPDLMQRPIVEKGAKAILARPAGRIKEIL